MNKFVDMIKICADDERFQYVFGIMFINARTMHISLDRFGSFLGYTNSHKALLNKQGNFRTHGFEYRSFGDRGLYEVFHPSITDLYNLDHDFMLRTRYQTPRRVVEDEEVEYKE